ncbi:hypothetical protein MTO96_003922 [Rhipicephalus appendiculatus]
MKISSSLFLLATVTVFAVIIFGTVMAAPKEHHRFRRSWCESQEQCQATCPPGKTGVCFTVRGFCSCAH